uniref:Uncharacterized protein n=1 Tax=Leersia perrieri TaxID=77586 RepID=A0A0D9W6I4_9ORYZ
MRPLFRIRGVRRMSAALAAVNAAAVAVGAAAEWMGVMSTERCERRREVAAAGAAVAVLAAVRIAVMVGAAHAQEVTAVAIVASGADGGEGRPTQEFAKRETRVRYKRWLWWTRFGMAVGAMQLFGAIYLIYVIVRDLSDKRRATSCFFGQDETDQASRQALIALFLILSWVVVIVQCFTGSDILRWRSFYATHDMAWKAHYREVFDHGIREALCCLGRAKTVLEEDEVYSVARLLGDLVAYRASGTGHLELLAGLALLQKSENLPHLQTDLTEAPLKLIQEAANLHPFAEACYTGPLLDFGRNPILFPCAWVYRQGVLTPWSRRRRPALDGDNWWRGHAAAFLRFAHIPAKALLRGRVCQSKREAAYFVVVLHDKKTVVIAVRGTETPEDLITDGLCRECAFTMEDLDGLVKCEQLPATTRERVISTFPHYGHGGILEAARELFMQLNDCTGDNPSSRTVGFLPTLVGEGSECHGYKIRVVGHSLGGAVATVLGMMLFGRYPDVHVYAYGPLPCVDFVIAEACSQFVTTIVCNDEFSSRLSINSILRLRSAAISALSDNSPADTAMIQKLARRILHVNKYHDSGRDGGVMEDYTDRGKMATGRVASNEQQFPRQDAACTSEPDLPNLQNGFDGYNGSNSSIDEYMSSQDLQAGCDVQAISLHGLDSGSEQRHTSYRDIPVEPPEMFLPGLVVHCGEEEASSLFGNAGACREVNHHIKLFWQKERTSLILLSLLSCLRITYRGGVTMPCREFWKRKCPQTSLILIHP